MANFIKAQLGNDFVRHTRAVGDIEYLEVAPHDLFRHQLK